ncbi:pyocin activator PrtN family protein [Paraburkholderia solisilvae]|uniref:pyocin activator PrtN family protein n=1 Tax=Paraburkholderia solisilvae TaxID=624376 RepID=UPI001581B06B|nr:pyocin activator PrtN family protein [Paraburkholderia solisilvae]
MNTAFLLMAQHGATAVVPFEAVCRDYFAHLAPDKLLQKIKAGEIRLPIERMERSQKSAKGVHIQDLAHYIDERRVAARKELEAVTRGPH